jgi:hypothetical protein
MNPTGSLPSLADAVADRLLGALGFAHACAVRAARIGSPASMIAASAVGVALSGAALTSWPAAPRAEAVQTVEASASIAPQAAYAPAPAAAVPPPPVVMALDYDVAYFWPKAPQTVAEAVEIREGPANFAKPIRAARPGERLRINGVVDEAPGGPWYRVRLEDGRDGFFAAGILEIGAFRRQRAQERSVETAGASPAPATSAGAPLVVAGPGEQESGPPSF